MPLLSIVTVPPTGLVGVTPQIIYIDTTDTEAQVTAAGYLDHTKSEGYTYNTRQMALVYTTDAGPNWYEISINTATQSVTLVANVNPGAVLLPVVVGHIASFTNVAGQIGDVATPITHLGNIIAGASGTAGTFTSFPATAANGSLIIAAVANVGNFTSTLSSVTALTQATVYTLADPLNATARVLVGATATPFTANHSLVATGTGGLIGDAGYQMKTVAAAVVAGGAAAQTIVDAFCTAASNVVGNWNTQTNAASVLKIVPGVGSFVVTSSADAGAGTFNYIITKV